MSDVVNLKAWKSEREPDRRVFSCVACGSFAFKVIEIDGEDHLGCANCEAWINEFDLVRTEVGKDL